MDELRTQATKEATLTDKIMETIQLLYNQAEYFDDLRKRLQKKTGLYTAEAVANTSPIGGQTPEPITSIHTALDKLLKLNQIESKVIDEFERIINEL